MNESASAIEQAKLPQALIPPLQNGDHLDWDEFERRWDAMPLLKRAELIEGVVFMSPAAEEFHAEPFFDLGAWMGVYRAATPGLVGANEATVKLDQRTAPQPDILLRVRAELGGQARRDAKGYVHGPPELAVEIVGSSASYDLHEKKEVYRRFGVKEYIVWRVYDAAVDWFVLREGVYRSLEPDSKGLLKSEVFPGLWLDAAALLRGDLAAVLKVVEEGIASPEHAGYVTRLGDRPLLDL